RKNPGFTALAVLVMALGIGANTAVFSVVNSVLLRPLAYRNPERIVTIVNLWSRDGQPGVVSPQVSAPDFHDWHDQSTAFDAMAYHSSGTTAISAGNSAEYGAVSAVTPEFLRVFDIQPVAGRPFSPEEEKPGSAGAALISYAFWQSHYGGQASAIGSTLRL